MQQKGNFLLMERSEFREWLKSQNITRKIDKLQVHHTYSPNYTTRKNQDHFLCLEGMRNFHMNTNGWSATGQNITTFEDGKIAISLDRNLNSTPAGIGSANTGAICAENIGNFDFGGDTITDEQKKTIVHVYACLAEKLKLPIDTQHIVYHHWYASDGTKIFDFATGASVSNKPSCKSCPGTNFLGVGNTVLAAQKSIIPLVKAEYEAITSPPLPPSVPVVPQPTETDNIKVVVNDKLVAFGRNVDGHIYLPIRLLGQCLGKTVVWDNDKKKVYVDGKSVDQFIIIDSVTYVQIRAASESFGAKVSWDNGTKKVYIYS